MTDGKEEDKVGEQTGKPVIEATWARAKAWNWVSSQPGMLEGDLGGCLRTLCEGQREFTTACVSVFVFSPKELALSLMYLWLVPIWLMQALFSSSFLLIVEIMPISSQYRPSSPQRGG